MRQLLVKYFLSLCIFLMGGSQVFAHSCNPLIDDVSDFIQNSELSALSPGENLDWLKKITSSDGLNFPGIEATEVRKDEDDKHELVPFRKHYDRSDFVSSLFCALTQAYLLSYVKQTLYFSKHFSDIHSRHLTFQVFRI